MNALHTRVLTPFLFAVATGLGIVIAYIGSRPNFDDAGIQATVDNAATGRRVTSQWSHLIADTQDELHQFATGTLGLRQCYFQPGRPHRGRPGPFWH